MRHTMNRFLLSGLTVLTGALPIALCAQEPPAGFQRREQISEVRSTVFHSPQSANLPTTETLQKGEWQFEISHRFFPPVSEGGDALWGFDGPVLNRLGLAYAASDRVMIGLLRTNLNDNLELNVKARLWEGGSEAVPLQVGVMGGFALNTAVEASGGLEDNESQLYGQVVLNALLGDQIALGVVPTLLRNPRLDDVDKETTFTLGLNGQIYVSEQVSFLGEVIISESRTDQRYNSGTFGIDLETGGHFFKIVLTNQVKMNPTQFLAGAADKFEADEWRVGFNITRLLTF